MPPKRKLYKQWQRDSSIPIPKRTLVRLKKKAGGILDINVNTAPAAERRYASDSNHSDDDVNEIVENNFILEQNRTSDDECADFPANDELNYGICDDQISIGEHADLDADEYSDRELHPLTLQKVRKNFMISLTTSFILALLLQSRKVF